MKKSISLCLLALVLIVGIALLTPEAQAADSDFEYTVSDGNVTITAYSGDAAELVIPDTLDGYPVTAIDDYAFLECELLESITIPDGVTYIGDEAFACCSSLESITIPDSVTYLGASAFSFCDSLQNAIIGSGITTIDDYAFFCCYGLESVTIGSSVTAIDPFAFSECYALTDVYYIGTAAQWESITIADGNDDLGNATVHYTPILTGDMDGSGETTNDDVIALMWHVLFPADNPVTVNADLNHDNSVDNNDVITLMWHILFPEDNPL